MLIDTSQASKHLLGDIQIHRHSKVPQHQSHLLLPLWPKHTQRLPHLPLARQGSAECSSLLPSARHADKHVLARRHVRCFT